MKKKLLAITLFASLFAMQGNAQVDQKTALSETTHGKEYYQFYDIANSEEGYSGDKIENPYLISHRNNVIGELSFFYMDRDLMEVKNIKGNPSDPKSDHYTKPSFQYRPANGKGMLILDGLIYEFEETKMEDLLAGKFKIKYIYVPKEIVDTKDDNVAFMKRLKYQKKTGFILSTSKAIADIDHNSKIAEYLKAMKPIQKKATASLTAEEKKNIQKIKEIRQKKIDEMNARLAREAKIRAERRKAENGNNSSGGSDEVTIINETGRSVCLVQGGSSTSFTSKESFDCDEPVYWGVKKGNNCTSDKRGIAVSAGQCGKEVVLR